MRAFLIGLLIGLVGLMPAGAAEFGNWPSHGGNSDETDFSSLAQINTANVGTLGLAWSLDLPGETTLEATPLAIDGVLYFTGTHATVYAVDAGSGKLLWSFDPETWRHNPKKIQFMFAANRGVAYADGRVFAAAMDGRLFALDAKTGKLIWSVDTAPQEDWKITVTGAPRAFKDKVIIGNGGADLGTRGYVTAYDAASGRLAWRFFTTPGSPKQNHGDSAMEKAARTWTGKFWTTGTGGAVWDSITYDAEFNRIYIGTGNAGPYDPELRSPGKGDNLFTASIVALDADSGKYVWHYQINPRDSWDFDSTQQMTLADLVIDGKPRKVLMQAPKNGFFYVIDRTNGKVISAEKFGKANWADRIDLKTGRPVETRNSRYENGQQQIWPFQAGAHGWHSMSFNPNTGLVYIPTMQLGVFITRGGPVPGIIWVGGVRMEATNSDPEDGKGALLAWDPVRQKAVWKVPHETIWNGGTLSTAGNLVFQGTGDGYFSAYDAENGKLLWRFNAAHGIVAAPISYSVGGRQYVSVLAGYGGTTAVWGDIMNAGWKYGAQPRRLLTFALDGGATLPPTAPPDMTVHALDDSSVRLKDADVEAGKALYSQCLGCHGFRLQGTGSPGPDLRESQIALHEENLWPILHDGALLDHGMPRFDNLTKAQVHQLYSYIRAGARAVIVGE